MKPYVKAIGSSSSEVLGGMSVTSEGGYLISGSIFYEGNDDIATLKLNEDA